MSLQVIGENIAELRRERGITQEDLARAVGVSSQAVSKWECGGTPDAELLLPVAEFFGVSIDRLFGRDVADYSDLGTEIMRRIASFADAGDMDSAAAAAMEFCWNIEKSLFGSAAAFRTGEYRIRPLREINDDPSDGHISPMLNGAARLHSEVSSDSVITLMSLLEQDLQYFMLFPEPKSGWLNALPSPEEFQKLFATLADPDVLNALFLINKREYNYNEHFTPGWFAKSLNIAPERAAEVLDALKGYQLFRDEEIKLDETTQRFFSSYPNSALLALLVAAREIIDRPQAFICHSSGRTAPLLR